jgi:hypothetical protein
MENSSPLYNARDLSPDQKRAVESLLGRILDDDEIVSVRTSKGQVLKSAATGEEREKAFRGLMELMDRTAKRVEGVPEEEINAAIDEAVDYVRHHRE